MNAYQATDQGTWRRGGAKMVLCTFHTSMLPTFPALGQADSERYHMGQKCTDQNWRGGQLARKDGAGPFVTNSLQHQITLTEACSPKEWQL